MCSLSPPSPISLYYFLQNNTPSTAKSLNSQVTSVGVQLLLHLPSMVPSMPPWLHLHLEVLHGFTFHTLKLNPFATVSILAIIVAMAHLDVNRDPTFLLTYSIRLDKSNLEEQLWIKRNQGGNLYWALNILVYVFIKFSSWKGRKQASKQTIHRE